MRTNKILKYFLNPNEFGLYILRRLAPYITNDILFLELLYFVNSHRFLNLKHPSLFNEKIMWLKLYNRNSEYTMMVDKYAVKEYIKNTIGEQYLIKTLGVWERPEDIEWNKLPNRFVLKTTHGGGNLGVVICKDKATLNINRTIKNLNKSLKLDIYTIYREWPYRDVKKRIIAEEYLLPDGGEEDLSDYKFYCFNGEPQYCQVIRNRNTKETIDFYDMNWNLMPFVGLNPLCKNGVNPVEKPKRLLEMIDICRKLSVNIPFVRIDQYVNNGKVYFGEITFFPNSGLGRIEPKEWERKFGDLIELPV